MIALMETLSYTLNVQVGDIKTAGTIIEREKTKRSLEPRRAFSFLLAPIDKPKAEIQDIRALLFLRYSWPQISECAVYFEPI